MPLLSFLTVSLRAELCSAKVFQHHVSCFNHRSELRRVTIGIRVTDSGLLPERFLHLLLGSWLWHAKNSGSFQDLVTTAECVSQLAFPLPSLPCAFWVFTFPTLFGLACSLCHLRCDPLAFRILLLPDELPASTNGVSSLEQQPMFLAIRSYGVSNRITFPISVKRDVIRFRQYVCPLLRGQVQRSAKVDGELARQSFLGAI